MKIEKVTYQKTYSIGPYLTDRVGFEASINEDEETPEAALSQLQEVADEWHKGVYPHLYQQEGIKEYMHSKLDLGYGPGVAPPADMSKFAKTQSARDQIIDYKKTEELEIAIDNAKSSEDLDKIKSDNPIFPAKLLNVLNQKSQELSK